MKDKLTTFVFTSGDRAISPPLVTVREYARWLETVYDEYTCNYELYLRATVGDTKVLEFHPGTRLGQYFDNTKFSSNRYDCWYIYQESVMMEKLNRMRLASYKDVAPVLSGQRKGLKLLRLYSADQINLYVRTKIDRTFDINAYLVPPKKIALRKKDLDYIIMPEVKKGKRSLLERTDTPVSMTVRDIEVKLGHRVCIIS
jgi:hypothetical protein